MADETVVKGTRMPGEYKLNGGTEKEDIDRRQTFLLAIFDNVTSKGSEIAQLRQRNLNYAIVILAGLSTLILKFFKGWYSVWVSFALVAIMCFFCLLDRRYHRYIHGWRKTEKMLMQKMESLLNMPSQDLEFSRYETDGENEAEKFGLMPWITYSLVAVAVCHLVYSVFLALTKG